MNRILAWRTKLYLTLKERENGTNDVIDAFVGSAIMGGSAHIETAMAQAMGATIGNSIGDQVKTAHQTSTEVNSSEATHVGATKALTNMGPTPDSSYYQAAAAAKGVGANASAAPASDMNALIFGDFDADAYNYAVSVVSNSNKPVTSANQQAVLPSARVEANIPSPSYTDQNPIFPYLLAPVPMITTAQSSMGNAWGMGNTRSTNAAQQPGFFNGLYQTEKQSYMSITKWSAATVESMSEVAKTMGKGYSMLAANSAATAKNILNAPVIDSLASESGSDLIWARAKNAVSMAKAYSQHANLLAKLSVYAKVGIISVDAVEKGIDVARAPQGQRARVGFVKGAELVGEVLGAGLGEAAVFATLPASLGTSFIVAPAVMVGTSAVGGYLAEWAAEGIENKYDSLAKRWGR